MATIAANQIKTMVSILQLIKDMDLPFRMKKDGKNYKIYKQDNQGNEIAKFLVSRLELKKEDKVESREVYRNLNDFDKSKPGSIIEFVANEVLGHNPNLPLDKNKWNQTISYLNRYINSSKFTHIDNSSIEINSEKTRGNKIPQKSAKELYHSFDKVTFDYFKSRKITAYNTELFFGKYGTIKGNLSDVFPSKYSEKKSTSEDKEICMPAFPLYDINKKLHTAQWINFDQDKMVHKSKYFLDSIDTSGAIFTSNFIKGQNIAVISESPEKNMAHYQLYEKDLKSQNLSPLYFSSCGELGKSHIETMQNHIIQSNIKQTCLAFDNDLKGVLFTMNFILAINNLDQNISVNAKQEGNNIELTFQVKSLDVDIQILNNHFNLSKAQEIGTNAYIISDSPEELKKIVNSPNIKVHNSITKDFLDDLNQSSYLPNKFTLEHSQGRGL